MEIEIGAKIEVTTARGERVLMRALSLPEPGHDRTIVWVCTEGDYADAGDEAPRIPWPADALRVLAET
jgi:hypothetical protein